MRVGLESLIDDGLAGYADESRRFYAQRPAGRGPQGFDELRAVRTLRDEQRVVPDPHATEVVAEADGRRVAVRVLAPKQADATAIYLDIHGGGFYMDSAIRGDQRNRRLAEDLRMAVVTVDYRLAPECPWPAAPDDCETVALWLLEQCERRFGSTRVVLGGFSAGATLAMTTLLRLRDLGIHRRISGAVLQFGTYDLSGTTPAGRLIAHEYFLDAYAGHVADRTVPDISPIFAELADLPPTLVVVGTEDVLLEDNLAMAARLSTAGNDVDLRIYPESPHGFTSHPTGMAAAARRDIEAWISTVVAG